MVLMSQFELFVQREPQYLSKPAEEILTQAQQVADEDDGMLTASTVEAVLGKDAAAALFRKVTEDPEYMKLAFG